MRARVEAAGGVWGALVKAMPELEGVGRVVRASTTAGLRAAGKPIGGGVGEHIYVLVEDIADTKRFLTAAHQRCWLAGYGWYLISRSGRLLERSIVDHTVGQPERLLYEGKPVLGRGLTQDAAVRRACVVEGRALNTTAVVLTEAEKAELAALQAAESPRYVKQANAVHEAWVAEHGSSETNRLAAEHHQLLPDFTLHFNNRALGMATVAEVLADVDKYANKYLADPLDGVEEGLTKAIVLKWGDGTPYIRSFAHGLNTFFRLTEKPESELANIGLVEAALMALGNATDVDWHTVALATHAATGGSEEGWAALNRVHPTAREAWDALQPMAVTAGTLFYLADEAQPGWRDEYDALVEGEFGTGAGSEDFDARSLASANKLNDHGHEAQPEPEPDAGAPPLASSGDSSETKANTGAGSASSGESARASGKSHEGESAGTPPLAKPRPALKTADPRVGKLNKTYLVLVGDKAAVMKTPADGGIKFLTLSAFEQWLGNKFVQYETKDGAKRMPLAKYWLHHPQRRQYEGIVFAPKRDVPGHYNLWKGFAVEPRPGDCSKFLAHLKDNVCCGSEGLYKWVIAWFAQIVQQPERKVGTSLVLRGKMGTGKTKVGEVFGSLFGTHYVPVSDPRYVTGRFNSHLAPCLLLHCDEAFWAGDHAAEGKLKDLITGENHPIEYKGKEPIWVRNYVRLFVTGNPDWMVPAGFEERRFAVLDIGDARMQDHKYFAAIDAEMDSGGREALLDHLLRFDLKTVNLREIPKTTALLDQKIASLTPERGWWLDVLMRGQLPWGCGSGADSCPVSRLFDQYVRHAGRRGVKRRAIETQLGMFLSSCVPELRRSKGSFARWTQTRGVHDVERYVYTFPPLAKCREAFVEKIQQEIGWEEPEYWTVEPPPDGYVGEDKEPPSDDLPF